MMTPTRSFTVLGLLLACLAPAQAQTVLITGANSGIGLEFARQYAERGWTVIATHRRDQTPESLAALARKHRTVHVERMDVAVHESVDALASRLQGTPIDVLINNAGIVRLGGFGDPAANAAQSLGTLDYGQVDYFVDTNVIGPIKVAEAFLEHLQAGTHKKIVNISSAAGSVSVPPRQGGTYWYRASKAALNSLMVTLAADLKDDGFTVLLLHPGFVRVERLSELELPGMVETRDSVAGMLAVIDRAGPADNGRFFQYTGEPQPW